MRLSFKVCLQTNLVKTLLIRWVVLIRLDFDLSFCRMQLSVINIQTFLITNQNQKNILQKFKYLNFSPLTGIAPRARIIFSKRGALAIKETPKGEHLIQEGEVCPFFKASPCPPLKGVRGEAWLYKFHKNKKGRFWWTKREKYFRL